MAAPQAFYAPGQTTVVIHQPVQLGANSQQLPCPRCHRTVVTRAESKVGTITWLASCLIFFLGGPFLCCLIPFCCRMCKNIEHRCPECGAVVGLYKRL